MLDGTPLVCKLCLPMQHSETPLSFWVLLVCSNQIICSLSISDQSIWSICNHGLWLSVSSLHATGNGVASGRVGGADCPTTRVSVPQKVRKVNISSGNIFSVIFKKNPKMSNKNPEQKSYNFTKFPIYIIYYFKNDS